MRRILSILIFLLTMAPSLAAQGQPQSRPWSVDLTPHFGFKLQAQWLPLWVDPEVQTFCSAVCVIRLSGQLASQGELSIGPVIRF